MKLYTLFTLLFLSSTLFSQIEENTPFLTQSETHNRVHINTGTDEPVEVKVLNSRGKIISTFTVRRKDTLHLNNLIPGTYYVQTNVNGQRKSGQFIKN